MDDILVSVIVPVYNVENYLIECLESILNQTYSFWECVLVDDGSTDKSGDICDEYAAKDQRFRVIHKENGGAASARNCAMEYTSGEYISFIESDDIIDKFYLEKAMRCAEESKPDLIQFAMTREVTLLGTNFCSKSKTLNAEQVRKDTMRFQNIEPLIGGKVCRTEAINGIRFNESCYVLEDAEFLARIMQNCSCTISQYKGYYYRITPGSLATQGLNKRKLIGSITSHNLCIQLLRDTDIEDSAYRFKYESLFNWLVRAANKDGWKELYHVIQKQILHDILHIIQSRGITLKMKILLYACGISPLLAHLCCKIRRQ